MAQSRDLPALALVERAAFTADRISPASWRRLMHSETAQVFVLPDAADSPAGAAVLLYRRRSSVARLYSIAVDGSHCGHGGGSALLQECIDAARTRGCSVLRLETREDNLAAQAMFHRFGFEPLAPKLGYYADGATALRFEKPLWSPGAAGAFVVQAPFHAQTLDFSCGACALLMAMAALRPGTAMDRTAEIRIWREATTVFMAAGHGGCGPYGLALAAAHRGFQVEVHAPAGTRLFVDSVRDPRKKEVIELVEADFRSELRQLPNVTLSARQVSAEAVADWLRGGRVPVVLISLWRLHAEKGPHWVVVTGFDGAVFRILDPAAHPEPGQDPGISVAVDEFRRITRYGRRRHTGAVVLSEPSA